jgi:hypothetical protein
MRFRAESQWLCYTPVDLDWLSKKEVNDRQNVVGIVDWEFSGWYPHYWEYTSAWYGNLTRIDWHIRSGDDT